MRPISHQLLVGKLFHEVIEQQVGRDLKDQPVQPFLLKAGLAKMAQHLFPGNI